VNQGDFYWYTFRPPDKRRPVLVLTRDSALGFLTSVTVAPITSMVRGIPTEVALSFAEGIPGECAVNCDNIQTVARVSIGPFVARLSRDKMKAVRAAIEFALGFDAVE
jgi:mRNA interferase MazF